MRIIYVSVHICFMNVHFFFHGGTTGFDEII